MKRLILVAIAAFCISKPALASDETVSCLATNIYHEARNQSIAGQLAVGLVTLNRVYDDRYPNSVCEVVYDGPHRPSWKDKRVKIPLRHRCQFSWYCDGKSDKIRDMATYEKIYHLAKLLLLGHLVDITVGATHYHAYYVTPAWAKTKTRTAKIEDHIFYRWEK